MMKKLNLTPAEQLIYNLLQVGKDKALSRNELMEKTGYSDRYIRENIRNLRLKGIRIISYSTGKGYWISGSRDDDQHYANEMRKRGQTCKDIVRGLNISLGKTTQHERQQSLFNEGENNEDK